MKRWASREGSAGDESGRQAGRLMGRQAGEPAGKRTDERTTDGKRIAAWARRAIIPHESIGVLRLFRWPEARRSLATAQQHAGDIVAGGVAMAPTLGVIAAVSAVVLNPLVTLSDLLTFLRWQALELVQGAGAALAARLADTPVLLRLAEGVAALVEAPPAALGGAVFLVVALLATASLVVYRNLIAPSLTGETHAQRTS